MSKSCKNTALKEKRFFPEKKSQTRRTKKYHNEMKLHMKLDLRKNYVKALEKAGHAFFSLETKLGKFSETKKKLNLLVPR